VNAPIELKKVASERTVDVIFSGGKFYQQLFEDSRNTFAQLMQIGDMGPRVCLNMPLRDRALDKRRSLFSRERRHFYSCEFVKMFPNSADLPSLIRSACDPDRDSVEQMSNESGDTRWRQSNLVEHDRFIAPLKIAQQAILALDDVALVVRPAKLKLQIVADPTQAGGCFAKEHRAILIQVSQQRRLSNS